MPALETRMDDKDLVAGSGLRFQDRGMHALKGVPGDWHIFAVEKRG
jgi:hypothetical protein